MAEKGGKGFSMSGKAKGKPKSQGKDDSSAKSQKTRKVHFTSPPATNGDVIFSPPKSNGTAPAPGKADYGKGGKAAQPNPPKAAGRKRVNVEDELPKDASCFMDCEAAQILEGINEQMVLLSSDPSIKIPPSFDHGLQHAKSSNCYTDPKAVRRALEPLTKHGLCDVEICKIANACPETADQAFAVIPSKKAKKNLLAEPIEASLTELAKLKKPA